MHQISGFHKFTSSNSLNLVWILYENMFVALTKTKFHENSFGIKHLYRSRYGVDDADETKFEHSDTYISNVAAEIVCMWKSIEWRTGKVGSNAVLLPQPIKS